MINLNLHARWRSPWLFMGMGCVLVVSSGLVYHWLDDRLTQPPVSIAAPVPQTVSALGRLEPDGELIRVFAPTSPEGARVERLLIKQGQQIRRGQVIAFLDSYTRRSAALRQAQEQVAVAQAQLKQVAAGAKLGQIQAQQREVDRLQAELQTETAVKSATIARLEAELRNATLEDRRYQSLQAEGAVSTSLRDSKQLTADTVQQQLKEAQAQLARIHQSYQLQIAAAQATLNQIAEVRPVDLDVVRAQIAAAQAGVAQAQAQLDLAVVRSPQDGQVLKIHTRPGELVGNEGLISLGQTRRMVAVAEVYELDISHIQVGQSATVVSKNNAFPNELHGQVTEVGLEIAKQDVLNTDPAAQFDARVVEVKVLLDEPSSRRVAGLSNLSIQVLIDVRS